MKRRWEPGIDPNDPGPLSRGPVRYFDPDQYPSHRVWLFLLGLVPKPARRWWPIDGFYLQPERHEWAGREAKRLMAEPWPEAKRQPPSDHEPRSRS